MTKQDERMKELLVERDEVYRKLAKGEICCNNPDHTISSFRTGIYLVHLIVSIAMLCCQLYVLWLVIWM